MRCSPMLSSSVTSKSLPLEGGWGSGRHDFRRGGHLRAAPVEFDGGNRGEDDEWLGTGAHRTQAMESEGRARALGSGRDAAGQHQRVLVVGGGQAGNGEMAVQVCDSAATAEPVSFVLPISPVPSDCVHVGNTQ